MSVSTHLNTTKQEGIYESSRKKLFVNTAHLNRAKLVMKKGYPTSEYLLPLLRQIKIFQPFSLEFLTQKSIFCLLMGLIGNLLTPPAEFWGWNFLKISSQLSTLISLSSSTYSSTPKFRINLKTFSMSRLDNSHWFWMTLSYLRLNYLLSIDAVVTSWNILSICMINTWSSASM